MKTSTILIVDDKLENIDTLSSLLKQYSYNLLVSKSGEDALTIIEENIPDLILLDILMPEMDGFEVCGFLKSNPKTREVPIIFMSALNDVENIVKGFEIGANDYITKPFQQQEVIARLSTHLKTSRLQKELYEAKEHLEEKVKQRTHELETSEAKYRLLAENVEDVIWKIDMETLLFTYISPSVTKMRGLSVEEALAETLEDALMPESLQLIQREFPLRINAFYQDKNKSLYFRDEIRQPCKNGRIIWVEIITSYIKYEDNRTSEIIGVSRDITEFKEMETRILNAMVLSEEKERSRYAKELHDGLGPLLATSMIYLHTLKDEKEPEKLTEYIDRTYDMLEEAVQSIREISNNLSPAILSKYGLVEAIQAFIEKLNLVSKIDFAIQSSIKCRFPEIIEFTIYRVIIELLNNSVKYAKAGKINIKINYVNTHLVIQYSDNGQGFEYEKIKKQKLGFGLINLENRIKKMGGQYEYFSSPGQGIKVDIKIQTNQV